MSNGAIQVDAVVDLGTAFKAEKNGSGDKAIKGKSEKDRSAQAKATVDKRVKKSDKKDKKRKKAKAKPAGEVRLTARTADKHMLYQLSVQDPESEIRFIEKAYKSIRKRKPLSLKEDFCGTALLSSTWVRSREDRTAHGVDLDASVLAWGEKHNVAPLGEAASRITLEQKNVLDPVDARFDVVCGYNYSYFIMKTRADLLSYFKRARECLNDEGVFFLDAYGGWESQTTLEESRKIKGFSYTWEQAEFNPLNNHATNYIHFSFKDGTKLKKAFRYDWRIWQLAELRELLSEAGFSETFVYWEEEDEDGEGTGTFKRATMAENDPGWNAYLVSTK